MDSWDCSIFRPQVSAVLWSQIVVTFLCLLLAFGEVKSLLLPYKLKRRDSWGYIRGSGDNSLFYGTIGFGSRKTGTYHSYTI